MKKLSFLLFTTLTLSFVFTSCESVDEAEKRATDFYSALGSADYERAISLFDENLIEDTGKEKLIELLKQRNEAWGAIGDRSKYSFNTITRNETTIVVLKYKISGANTVYEKLEFMKQGSDYKIVGYVYNPDQDAIDQEL